jgi:hypothetical protein
MRGSASVSNHLKNVRGQLVDMDNYTSLGEGDVRILFIPPSPPSSHPIYQATIKLQGFRSDLDGKTCLLRLNEQIVGEVMLVIPKDSVFDTRQSTFNVHLQGSNWNDLDWFHSL